MAKCEGGFYRIAAEHTELKNEKSPGQYHWKRMAIVVTETQMTPLACKFCHLKIWNELNQVMKKHEISCPKNGIQNGTSDAKNAMI